MLSQSFLQNTFKYNHLTGEFKYKDDYIIPIKLNKGYLYTVIGGKKYYIHRLIYMYVANQSPFFILHLNLNFCDNRWSNFAIVKNLHQLDKINIPGKHITGMHYENEFECWNLTTTR